MRPAKGPAALSQHRPCVHLSRTLVSPQRRGGRWLSTWRAGAPPPASSAPWHLSHHPGSILSAMRPQKTRLLLRSREPWCAPLQSPGKRGRGRGQPRGRRLPDGTPREADLALVACPRKGLTRLVVPPEPRGRPGCGSQGLRTLSEPLALQQAHHAGKQARGLWGQAGSGDRCLTGKARLSSQGHKPKVSRGHSLGMSSCQSGQPCT